MFLGECEDGWKKPPLEKCLLLMKFLKGACDLCPDPESQDFKGNSNIILLQVIK